MYFNGACFLEFRTNITSLKTAMYNDGELTTKKNKRTFIFVKFNSRGWQRPVKHPVHHNTSYFAVKPATSDRDQ